MRAASEAMGDRAVNSVRFVVDRLASIALRMRFAASWALGVGRS